MALAVPWKIFTMKRQTHKGKAEICHFRLRWPEKGFILFTKVAVPAGKKN
jgi:hypothetical protein